MSLPLPILASKRPLLLQKGRAKETWLSHLAHEVDYEEGSQILPPEVKLAYDGLEVKFHAN
jgi:phosphoribosyl 1,2-cyclic phosphodiesterase